MVGWGIGGTAISISAITTCMYVCTYVRVDVRSHPVPGDGVQ